MDEPSLRILQANLGGGVTMARSPPERATALAALIRQRDVDVVILQAGLDAAGGTAPIDALCALHPGYRLISHFGMAILSRVPIEAGDVLALSSLGLQGDLNARHLLLAYLPEHDVTLANAHFSWEPDQAERNVAEATGLLARHGDALLVGDFNQPPEAGAIATLTAAGFVDAWARLRSDAAGHSYETGNLTTRIDYVFERAATPMVRQIALLAAEPDSAISNHALLLAEIAR